ncbi:hypothetical protein HYALB_00010951 [Hymenoscyphus albidus]|uniref:Altered inheritance of mitochondria protein 32 n=1 Tax=Hymenoscyphus albidus TaxID=595503 RepID=A0A9N9LKQ2_9HELO|nr:hypothetical protein HYALB_00010951 [Hymenoscyphus albidus]
MLSRHLNRTRGRVATLIYKNVHGHRPLTFRHVPPPFPTTPKCPSPSCPCAETPNLPDLPIDHKANLNGTMAPYDEHVLICTGKDDWMSRVEEENSGDNLAADLKELLGRGGIYADPYHNVSITNSSFPPSRPGRPEIINASAYLLPSFKYIPFLPRISFDTVQALTKAYLLPTKLHPAHDNLSPIHRDRLLRNSEYASNLYGVRDVKDVLVLICGHGGRDARCGAFGPILRDEFASHLKKQNLEIETEAISVPGPSEDGQELTTESESIAPGETARVGLISHIGGHKFAGNVIIYIPPGKNIRDEDTPHPLAGCGIWYGRVEPKHVEGIVEETFVKGNVIEEFFRGGIRQSGEILRI